VRLGRATTSCFFFTPASHGCPAEACFDEDSSPNLSRCEIHENGSGIRSPCSMATKHDFQRRL
jgi:hypothetical protein